MSEVINFENKQQIQSLDGTNRSFIKIDLKPENSFDNVKSNQNNTAYNKDIYHTLLKDIQSEDPMDYISIAKSAVITQQIDTNIFLAGCEPPIRYIIHLNTYLNERKKVFQCREVHDWWQKNCYQ